MVFFFVFVVFFVFFFVFFATFFFCFLLILRHFMRKMVFLYEFAEKTAQKPDTVATYVRRNKKIFKNHVERRQKQIWLDEKAVDI